MPAEVSPRWDLVPGRLQAGHESEREQDVLGHQESTGLRNVHDHGQVAVALKGDLEEVQNEAEGDRQHTARGGGRKMNGFTTKTTKVTSGDSERRPDVCR